MYWIFSILKKDLCPIAQANSDIIVLIYHLYLSNYLKTYRFKSKLP